MKTVSIIVPVYNESKTIDDVIKRILAVTLDGWRKEIIIVDDGSTDETPKKLKKWAKKIRIVRLSRNTGKGSAIQSGIAFVRGELTLIQDADLEYDPSDYPILLAPFDHSQVDAVYGSRFLGSHLSTMYLYALGNKFVTLATNILFNSNITDMETGYKVFRTPVLLSMKLVSKRFDFEPEVTAKLLRSGHQIYEVPISYFGRKFSDGKKLTWRDGVTALWTLLKCRVIPD